jgi:hypothetical protein
MDLSLLIASETADCTITDLVGNDTDIVITVYGKNANKFEAAARKGGMQKDSDDIDFLIDVTVGWANLSFEGKSLTFNRENARKIYTLDGTDIRYQVEAFIRNQENFLPKR